LSGVGQNYTPLQNEKSFDFFNKFVESGLCRFETAGSLFDGKKVWILAEITSGTFEVGKGDTVKKYFLLSNGHDGKSCVKIGFTPIRVVCNNTLARSESTEKSSLLRVWHGQNVETNVEKLKDIVNMLNLSFEATAEQYRYLASKQVNSDDLSKFVRILQPRSFEHASEERQKLSEEKLTEEITRLFETGIGQDLDGAKGTYWGLYNAVTQYLSYDIGRDQNRRLDNLWFGVNRDKNTEALNLALNLAR